MEPELAKFDVQNTAARKVFMPWSHRIDTEIVAVPNNSVKDVPNNSESHRATRGFPPPTKTRAGFTTKPKT
jgi:hypothetical protein